ncbi:MAG: hypothetical protein E7168_04950 [Firmicutes bacterium]|nr:hypothetical protein [Bacillota bacterium]
MQKIFLYIGIISLILLPTTTVKAETLKDYKNLLNKYIAEQKANNNKIDEANTGINNAKKEIENIKKELQEMTDEIAQLKLDVISYNNEIKEKEVEIKEIIVYYQMSQGDNVYLEYAFGAESITDLIYRVSVVEQLITHNKQTIEKLNQMIIDNQNREIEINKKEIELNERQEELSKKISDLTGVKASLNENSVSVAKQIQIYRDIIKGYEEQGCKDNHVIGRDCAVTSSVVGWFRPIQSGYVTSEFGYRWGSLHRAVDVSNKNPYSTKIYPVADGKITAKYYDDYEALTIVIEHRTRDGKYYSSLYTHMSKFAPNIYVGKEVKHTDYIGYMGATGLAYGPHLHLEIAPCRLYNHSDKNCYSWDSYVAYVKRIYNNGSFKGPRDLIYFPKQNILFTSR